MPNQLGAADGVAPAMAYGFTEGTLRYRPSACCQAISMPVTATELLRRLHRAGCVELRRSGSHVIVRCGQCQTVIPVHRARDLPPGTLGAIRRHLAPCLAREVLGELGL